MTKGPIIKIAPTEEEKKEQKHREKQLDVFRIDEIDPVTKIPISERHRDQFFGGPLDSQVCDHQPNGPRAKNDPKGLWADYFIKDKVKDPNVAAKIPGYHVYSPFYEDTVEAPSLGSRTVRMRKCYYYVGFVSESVLAVDGIMPDKFTGILTMS